MILKDKDLRIIQAIRSAFIDDTMMKFDLSLPDTFEVTTACVDAKLTKWLIAHHSSERTSLLQAIRGNITVKLKGAGGKSSTHVYKVKSTSEIELIAVESDKVMTQMEIDIVADSIADFLLQNYLRKHSLSKA